MCFFLHLLQVFVHFPSCCQYEIIVLQVSFNFILAPKFYYHFLKRGMSIKDRIAMFQKLNSGSTPTFPQKKQTISNSVKPTPVSLPQTNNLTKSGGQVESPPIVKPNMFKQTQLSNSSANQNNTSNKMTSSHPWVQQSSTPKIQQKTAPPAWVKQPKSETQHPPQLKQTTSQDTSIEAGKSEAEKLVKISENALVDKQSLPSQNAMKALIEGRLVGLIGMKKPQDAPKKVFEPKIVDSGPKETPVIETGLKIGSVKENANKLNNFFQAKGSEQHQTEKAENKHKQEHEVEAHQGEKQKQQIHHNQSQTQEEPFLQSNTQNIVGGAFLQPEQLHTSPTHNVDPPILNNHTNQTNQIYQTELSIPICEPESKQTKAEENTLATRLIKRKKLNKGSFDSDED